MNESVSVLTGCLKWGFGGIRGRLEGQELMTSTWGLQGGYWDCLGDVFCVEEKGSMLEVCRQNIYMVVRTVRVHEKETPWNMSILRGRQGERSPKRNIKIEGDPQGSSVPGPKALGSFRVRTRTAVSRAVMKFVRIQLINVPQVWPCGWSPHGDLCFSRVRGQMPDVSEE